MKNLSVLLLIVLLSSCASNRNVVQNGFFQKRKYKNGYHLSFKKKIKNETRENSKSIEVKAVVENKNLKQSAELVVVGKLEVQKKENENVEEPLVSSLDMLDYSAVSILEKAILLSDSIKTPVDENEKVYVKKWDIVTLISVGSGVGLYAGLFALYDVVSGVSGVLTIVGAGLFFLGVAAIILGLILLHRRFIAPKRKIAKAKELEERKIREAERKVREAEEVKKAEIEKENTVLSEKDVKRIEIRSKKWYLARVLSYVFTTLTLVFPFFVIPATVYTIMVMNIERKNEKNWVRISAVFRLVFLSLFAFVGLVVFAEFLELIGVLV